MPERILRPGIITSERVNSLTFEAEVFYRRLMSAVDDFGRFDARPSILRAALYPLKIDSVKEADIESWISECTKADLLKKYAVEGRYYLEMNSFRQRLRAAKASTRIRQRITCIRMTMTRMRRALQGIRMTMPSETETEAIIPPLPLLRRGAG